MKNKNNNSSVLVIIWVLSLVFILAFLIYFGEADIRNLKNIGYSKDEISFIKKNKIPVSIVKEYEYIDRLPEIVNNENYNIDNFDGYLNLYKSNRSIDDIIYIVNNDIDYPYSEKLISLINNKYFILNNLDRYMSYPSDDTYLTVKMVNSNRDYDFYTNTLETNTSYGILMLVNKYYYLDKDYVYGDLVTIEDKYSNNPSNMLNSEAYESFKELVDMAELENLHIRCNYAYRSYSYQEGVYNNYKNTNGLEYADSISARPGYSEHQTGLALDVGVQTKYSNDKFQYSKEYLWMKDNSYKYGFILRYPEGKENITGYNFESWHYRYVGKEAAKFIYDNDLTLEEYYAYYVNK